MAKIVAVPANRFTLCNIFLVMCVMCRHSGESALSLQQVISAPNPKESRSSGGRTSILSLQKSATGRLDAIRGGSTGLMEAPTLDESAAFERNVSSPSFADSQSLNPDYNLTFLASTAGSIAAYRAAVTFLNSSYIDDPFSIMFARETNPEKLASAKLKNASELARFAVRTRFFDEFIRDAVFRDGIRQVCHAQAQRTAASVRTARFDRFR
jgi:hypothetical protein